MRKKILSIALAVMMAIPRSPERGARAKIILRRLVCKYLRCRNPSYVPKGWLIFNLYGRSQQRRPGGRNLEDDR